MNKVHITGVQISDLTSDELLNCIKKYAIDNRKALMLSGNVHSLNTAYQSLWYKKMLNQAEIVRNDSAGLMIGAKILGHELKERMTWADFGWQLAAFCEKEGLTQYFLGNKPGIPDKAKVKLKEKHPDLKVVGTHHGYFEKEGPENDAVIEEINSLKPDILIVGFGMPLQEKWILDNGDRLEVGIIMTGGNCFTFLAGEESRAPKWMHENGLEWLYRFLKEPRRMFGRYIIGNPLFFCRVLLQKLGKEY